MGATLYIGADNAVIVEDLYDTIAQAYTQGATVTYTLYRRVAVDGVAVESDETLTSASAPFVSGDASRSIIVVGADSNGGDLRTTVASYTSTSSIELTAAPSVTLSGCEVRLSVTNATAVSMSYVTGTTATYRGLIDEGVKLKAGERYWIEISVDAGGDKKDFRMLPVRAEYRGN